MTTLLECREWLKRMYGKYSLYISAAIRFVLSLGIFLLITYRMGYMGRLKNPVIPLVLALVCTFVPVNLIVVFAVVLLILHLYALSMEIALIMLAVFLILYMIYYRFSPKYGIVLLLTPLAFVLKIPYVLPVILGLAATPITVVPLAFGSFVYYLLHYIAQYGLNAVNSAGSGSNVQKYVYVFVNAIKEPEMYLYILAFAAALVLVYFIRRLSVDNAWVVAIFTGVICEWIFILAGNFVLDITISFVWMIIGTILAVLLAIGLRFFVFHVDYSRTEYVQFEDDEYYYYVKAVPKVRITRREKTVKRINPQKSVNARNRSSRELEDI